MIENLEISNFQSHKKTSIAFHHGMNVITGSSDSGKSAIMRALIWAINNRPSGGAFKTWGTKETDKVEVSLEFDNGWFTKERVTKNKYICDEGSFEALRSDVPDAIRNIANITDYNIQTQFQPYFMLQDSPGDRAKRLNELVGLDIIDRIFKKLNSKISSVKMLQKQTADMMRQTEQELEDLKYVDALEPVMLRVAKNIDSYNETLGKSNSLREMIRKIQQIDSTLAVHREFLKIEPEIKKVQTEVDSYDSTLSDYESLTVLTNDIIRVNKQIEDKGAILKAESLYAALMAKMQERDEYVQEITNRNQFLDAVELNHENLIAKRTYLNGLIERYAKLLVEAKLCPTCASEIHEDAVKNIISKLKN